MQQAAGNGNVSESGSESEVGVPLESRKRKSDGAEANRSKKNR